MDPKMETLIHLRGKIKQFASTISLQGGQKVVILDEADYLKSTIYTTCITWVYRRVLF